MADAESRPIGLRQHNPLNLRITKDKWLEALPPEPGDEFVRFRAPQYGIRAGGRTILNYDRRGWNTVRLIISHWAPDHENNTDAYIADVAQRMGVDADDWLDLDDYATASALVKAIIIHENGRNPYKEQVIADGLRMAGIHDAPKKALVKKGAFVAQATAGAGTTLALASQAVEPVKKVADGLDPFAASPIVQQIGMALLTVCAALSIIGAIGVWLQHRKGL